MSDHFVLTVLRSLRRCERSEACDWKPNRSVREWGSSLGQAYSSSEVPAAAAACCPRSGGWEWLRWRAPPAAVHSGGAYEVQSGWGERGGENVSQCSPPGHSIAKFCEALSLYWSLYSLRYADDTTLMAESEEELKSLLMKVKEENEKTGLKLNIQKIKILVSGPITSWQMWKLADFAFLGSKITGDGDCNHEIKRHLLIGRKAMTGPDRILKSRDTTLPTKLCLVKAIVLQVVGDRCESWTIKKAEHRRIDAFLLWCWRGLLRIPWTARRSNKSILKEINPEYSLERLMLKLKLQYFGHLMWRADSM